MTDFEFFDSSLISEFKKRRNSDNCDYILTDTETEQNNRKSKHFDNRQTINNKTNKRACETIVNLVFYNFH